MVAANNSPNDLARSACTVLDLAISLFDKAPAAHPVVRNGLVSPAIFFRDIFSLYDPQSIILRLRERSRTFVIEDTCRRTKTVVEPIEPVKVEEVEEALSAIGGENRVVKKPLQQLQERYPSIPSANDTPIKDCGIPSPIATIDGSVAVPTSLLPFPSHIGVGDTSLLQYLESLIPSQVHDPTPHANLPIDISNYQSEASIDSLYHEVFPSFGSAQWGIAPSSWSTVDWANLDIPENFDFDVDTATNPVADGGDDMILDAWNFILEEPRSKHNDNGVNYY